MADASRTKRLSCDRCHSQKVRCTRVEGSTSGECDRCLRKGSKCVYSSCLPKGRPSLYRAAETAAAASASSGSRRKSADQASSSSSYSCLSNNASKSHGSTAGTGAHSSAASSPDMCSRSDSLDTHMEEVIHVSPPHMTGDGEQSGACGDQVEIREPDFSLLHFPPDDFAGFSARWGDDHEDGAHDHMPLDLPESGPLDPALLSASLSSHLLGFDDQFVSKPDVGVMAAAGVVGFAHTQVPSLGAMSDIINASNASTIPSAQSISTTSPAGTGAGLCRYAETLKHNMARLSQLNASASELLFFSKAFLAEVSDVVLPDRDLPAQAHQAIRAVFKSVNTWLGRGSQCKLDAAAATATTTTTTTKMSPASTASHELLHHLLSASDQLQDILRQIHLTCSGVRTRVHNADPEASSMASWPVPHESCQDYSIVCQLAVVCTMMLLNMYSVAFNALQRCLDVIKASSGRPRTMDSDDMDEHMEESSQTHLQLVSVIHVCSYSFTRQIRALETVLNSQAKRTTADAVRQSDAIVELNKEVEAQLTQLRQSLHAVA